MNETDLRAMLADEAERFRPDPKWLSEVSRPPQAHRRALITMAVGVAAILIGTMIYVAGKTAPGAALGNVHPVYIRLTGYMSNDGGGLPPALQRHIACMRSEGFDLPDPRRVAHGWVIKIVDPRSIGLGSARWKKAAFDTCALVRNRITYDRWIRKAVLHPRPRTR
jgi:hypothetical protein